MYRLASRAALAAAIASVGLLGWASGCKGSSDTGPQSGAGPDNRQTCGADLTSDVRNCGACGNACAENHYCKAGACEAGCPDRVLYVAPTGDDLNTGCFQNAPRKTIGATIALARNLGMIGHEVHVCQGTYTEAGLSLDYPLSLRGGYDCTSWTRASTFGMAGGFDQGRETILAHDGGAGATLSIRGSGVDAQVLVDGFTIRGGDGNQGGGAVLVSTGAAPRLSDDQIAGGAAVATGDLMASYGIYVQAAAAPEIAKSRIAGGSGSAHGSFGSVGIAIASDAGQPFIHDNQVDGGTGTTTVGVAAVGVLFSGQGALTGARAVQNNVIHGGSGHVMEAAGTGSIGVLVNQAAPIELLGNVIEGGSSSCVGPCPVRAVSVSGTSGVHIAGNRIYGGDASTPSATAWGVLLDGSNDAIIENDMVHGGGANAVLNAAYAVEVSGSTGAIVRGNTLLAPPVSSGGQGVALGITRQSTGASVENNLLVGGNTPQGVALLLFACPAGSAISTFHNNVFANFTSTFAYSVTTTSVACDTRGALSTAAALEQFLSGTAGASSAGGDAVSAATPASIFAAWTSAKSGYPELVSGGWKLAKSAPCAIARGGMDLGSALPADAFGAARSVPFSVGACELADKSACTQ